ncbi:MAG: TrmB family transcriptional regulator [Halanaerobiales bacterium]
MIKNKEEIIDTLSDLGFNKYEAEAYLILLQKGNISAYEISKKSGVPQSKIYETVKKLVERGLAVARGSNPVKYSPLPINEFLDRYKSQVEDKISYLKENLKDIDNQPQLDYMWHFDRKDQILNKASSIIKNAERKLNIEIWDEQLELLIEPLNNAEKRDVEIMIVLYGEKDCNIGQVYHHQMEGMRKEARRVGKWLTINKDGDESLFGIFSSNNHFAVWTKNKSFMLLAENFITHDIFIAEIYKKFKKELDEEFGANLKKLRKIFD